MLILLAGNQFGNTSGASSSHQWNIPCNSNQSMYSNKNKSKKNDKHECSKVLFKQIEYLIHWTKLIDFLSRIFQICNFCLNNNRPEKVYSSHILKDNKGRILCDYLRSYTCPICFESGDRAHTIKYCPKREIRKLTSETGKLFSNWTNSTIFDEYHRLILVLPVLACVLKFYLFYVQKKKKILCVEKFWRMFDYLF